MTNAAAAPRTSKRATPSRMRSTCIRRIYHLVAKDDTRAFARQISACASRVQTAPPLAHQEKEETTDPEEHEEKERRHRAASALRSSQRHTGGMPRHGNGSRSTDDAESGSDRHQPYEDGALG